MFKHESKAHAFTRTDTTYKTVAEVDIDVSVFVPRDVKSGSLPIHIRWHGGALINGDSHYEGWFPSWTIDLASHHHAILIAPNYRLLPESSGTDILSDLHSFYVWLHTSFPSYLTTHSPNHTADISRILITGESAGGYMSLQSALLAHIPGLRALILHYPLLDLLSPHFTVPGKKNIWGRPSRDLPTGWIDDRLTTAKHSPPVTSRIPADTDVDLYVALVEAGRYNEVLGEERELYPFLNLEKARQEGKKLPPIWIVHGSGDTVVPIGGTLRLVGMARKLWEGEHVEIPVTVVDGKEHGFDKEGVGLEDVWVRRGYKWVASHWLS